MKSSLDPGRWRVTAETDDGRAMAAVAFTVKEDAAATERKWRRVAE